MAVFFSIVASIMVLTDHNTKGTRQGNIKHVPKTRAHCPYQALKSIQGREPTSKQVIGILSSPGLDDLEQSSRSSSKMGNLPHFVCDFFYDLSFIINL
jgi:hypothetical protein